MINFIKKPSTNYNNRGNFNIDKIIIHYTDMACCDSALNHMCNEKNEVSAHYLIDTDCTIYHLVNEEDRAWHAGVASWQGDDNLNSTSIGIELQNQGQQYGYQDFPDIQINALIELIKDIKTRYKIAKQNILAHSDIAPNRKIDPDYKFPWKKIAEHNLCIYPKPTHTDIDLFDLLEMIGYDLSNTENAVKAFQRRYRPNKIDGIGDDECAELAMGIILETEKI